MFRNLLTSFIFSTVTATSAFAACEDVIRMSRNEYSSIMNKDVMEQQARTFCSEYRSVRSGGSASGFNAAYRQLTSGFSTSNTSQQNLATRICEETGSNLLKRDAYQEYVNVVAPLAFDAYKACLEFTGNNVGFSVDRNAVLATDLTILIEQNSSGGDMTSRFRVSPTGPIVCAFRETGNQIASIVNNGQAALSCTRRDPSKEASVTVYRVNGRGSLVMRWGAYSADGTSLDALAALREEVRILRETVARMPELLIGTLPQNPTHSGPNTWSNAQSDAVLEIPARPVAQQYLVALHATVIASAANHRDPHIAGSIRIREVHSRTVVAAATVWYGQSTNSNTFQAPVAIEGLFAAAPNTPVKFVVELFTRDGSVLTLLNEPHPTQDTDRQALFRALVVR